MSIAICLGDEDPYAFIVRSCLLNMVPVLATRVGARKDIPEESGLVKITHVAELANYISPTISNLVTLESQCARFRSYLGGEKSTGDRFKEFRRMMMD